MHQVHGNFNDAYADGLSFVLEVDPDADPLGVSIGGYPDLFSPGPHDRKTSFFYGGSDGVSGAQQVIDTSEGSAEIDQGNAVYILSGFLGGFANQEDAAVLKAVFKDGDGLDLGTAQIGPVTAADRGNGTGLLFRTASGVVPQGTRSIVVGLTQTRSAGAENDGYADSLSLVLLAAGWVWAFPTPELEIRIPRRSTGETAAPSRPRSTKTAGAVPLSPSTSIKTTEFIRLELR